jgi:hypothetical protein
MFAGSTVSARRRILAASAVAVSGLVLLVGGFGQALPSAHAQDKAVPTAREILGPAAFVPLAEQPPAKLIVDPPLPDQLAKGVVVIQFRTENLRMSPVFGPAALAVSPRIGHLRVTVDGAPWHWLDASGQPVDVGYLPPGPHKIRIELVNANGEPLAQSVLKFEVPKR